MMKKIKYIAFLLTGITLAVAGSVSAGMISVPSSSGFGQILVGLTTGNYQASSSPTIAGTVTARNFVATSTASSTFPVFYSATGTVSNLNGVIYVDGVRYAKTEAGIQAAVNACSAITPTCTTVDLLDTQTQVSSGILLPSNIRITSSASSSLTSYATFSSNSGIFYKQGSTNNVKIDNIKFNLGGNATAFSNRGGKNVVFEKNYVTGTTTAVGAVIFDGNRGTSATSTDFIVVNNTFENLTNSNGASTIYFLLRLGHGIVRPTIDSNIFINTGGPAVKVDEQDGMYGLSFVNNKLTNQTSGNHYYDPAVALWAGLSYPYVIHDTIVSDNIYDNSVNFTGYTFGGGLVYIYQAINTTISNNIVKGSWVPVSPYFSGRESIGIAPGRVSNPDIGMNIYGNTFERLASVWDPDSMQNVNVSNNIVRDSGQCFDPGYNIQIDIHIHNNKCYNTISKEFGAAIAFYNASPAKNIVVENNSYYFEGTLTLASSSQPLYDIYYTGSGAGYDFSDTIVRNNTFYHPGATTTQFIGYEGSSKPSMEIWNNKVDNQRTIDNNLYLYNTGVLFLKSSTTPSGTTTTGLVSTDSNFVWDNTNKRFGIGTSSPYAKLSVAGQAVAQYFTATDAQATSTLLGSLAIGTTSSNDILHISSASGTGMLFDRPATTDNQSSEIKFKYGNNQFWAGIIRFTKVSGGGGALSIGTGGAGGASTNEALYITNGQKIGLGTSAPDNKLHVAGGIQTSSTGSSPAGQGTVLSQESGYGRLQSYGSTPLVFNSLGNNVGVASTSPFAKFSVTGAGASTGYTAIFANSSNVPLMNIQDNGLVGIGTTSPYAKLSVTGTSGATTPLFAVASSTNALSFAVLSNGLQVTGGSVPTVATSTGSGTGSVPVKVLGAPNMFNLNITTGTTPAGTNAVIATVTLPSTCPSATVPVFSPANANASALAVVSVPYASSTGASTFNLVSGATGLAGATNYKWNFSVGCY